MTEEDSLLLKFYLMGFRDELRDVERDGISAPLYLHAYNLGRVDAIVGDDVSSVDYQTDEEILNRIRN